MNKYKVGDIIIEQNSASIYNSEYTILAVGKTQYFYECRPASLNSYESSSSFHTLEIGTTIKPHTPLSSGYSHYYGYALPPNHTGTKDSCNCLSINGHAKWCNAYE